MTESVYKVIELVGTSTDSWEKAATAAVELAAKSFATSAWLKWSNKIWSLRMARCALSVSR